MVDPFLEGLLPDRLSVREALAQRFSVSPRNPFALLAHMGMECAGAVQLVDEAHLEQARAGEGALVPLTEEEIGQRLQSVQSGAQPSWVAPQEGWSLAGAQTKIALHRTGGVWHEARGATPTTHILKPGISGMREQALGEHLCLQTLAAAGLPAARCEYRIFGEVEALVVARYDRVMTTGGVVRLHQEDLCQATGTRPHRKYEADGGPGAVEIIRLLSRWCDDDGASARAFLDQLIANVLLGAPDAHAKNYSLLHAGNHIRLAPAYDVASGLPYKQGADSFGSPGQAGWRTSAMAIGGRRNLEEIGRRQWHKLAADANLAETAGMGADVLVDRVAALADLLPHSLAQAIAQEQSNPALEGKQIPSRLLSAVRARCREAGDLL